MFELLDKPQPQVVDPKDAVVRVTLGSVCGSLEEVNEYLSLA